MTDPRVSIVVPTHDGADTLPTTLRALARQAYPHELVDVIVVDDGSTDGTTRALPSVASPELTVVRQERAGAAAARNAGAALARGSILVFCDDDVEPAAGAIRELVDAHRDRRPSVVVGHLTPPPPSSAFEALEVIASPAAHDGLVAIDFTEAFTGLLSVAAVDFEACGGFRDPTGGWPSWDDIDFGYRAQRLGLCLVRCGAARAVHHDRAACDLTSLCLRWHAASVSAVRLFQRHPGIEHAFPSYRDKLPIKWRQDPWPLVAQKLLRAAVSTGPLNRCVRGTAKVVARSPRLSVLARPLCGLSLSGSMWLGLRDGIARFGPLPDCSA